MESPPILLSKKEKMFSSISTGKPSSFSSLNKLSEKSVIKSLPCSISGTITSKLLHLHQLSFSGTISSEITPSIMYQVILMELTLPNTKQSLKFTGQTKHKTGNLEQVTGNAIQTSGTSTTETG